MSAAFEPIAIVGRGCVLPGCLTPDALWQAVVSGRSLLSLTPPRKWGLTAIEERNGQLMGGIAVGAEAIERIRQDLT